MAIVSCTSNVPRHGIGTIEAGKLEHDRPPTPPRPKEAGTPAQIILHPSSNSSESTLSLRTVDAIDPAELSGRLRGGRKVWDSAGRLRLTRAPPTYSCASKACQSL